MITIDKKVTISNKKNGGYYYEEAMKTFRTNVSLSGRGVRCILFTSTLPNEGKSELSFQLALQFAEAGKKVMLVDADIRKSTYLAKLKSRKGIYGLSEYLSGQTDINQICFHTNYENMDMIFAGAPAPNPSELFEDEAMKQLVEMLKQNYDYVIIDAAPVGAVIDAAILGKYCDGAVYVIASESVSYKQAAKAKEQLERSGCKILGAVLNKVNPKHEKYYGKRYRRYGKYGKYSRYSKYY